jgi:hypothetical protein
MKNTYHKILSKSYHLILPFTIADEMVDKHARAAADPCNIYTFKKTVDFLIEVYYNVYMEVFYENEH